MAFIEVSFEAPAAATSPAAPGLHFGGVDVVAVAIAAGFPLRGAQGRFCILHGDRVGQLPTSQLASVALRELPGAEILMFLYEGFDRCVACHIRPHEEASESGGRRVVLRINLAGSPTEEQHEAARALSPLLDRLTGVKLQAELAELAES